MYQEGLVNCKPLTLPPPPDDGARHFDVYQNYELEADRRDYLKAYLESRGIRTLIQWGGTPVHHFKELGFTVDLPKTDAFFGRCLMLPMNPALTNDDVSYVIETVCEFYSE